MAGNGEGGARYSPEQSHGAAVQRLSPSGGCGGRWRSGATEERRKAQRRARRWQNLLPFRLLFGGGARLTTLTSWTEAQSEMEGNGGRIVDGGHGGGEVREREDDEQ
ncbi:hypothetical protein DEO72_LG8g1853 [Vigna unguiculata]|uniref:Uncharacterized protein n=1 Tax=Vigna unguiculata TaxID=3917 RepID=A0A4D6MV99_VIGUN|nr:hypothetical protein DEO72_LG8g1853 [Vigna unguiculata]